MFPSQESNTKKNYGNMPPLETEEEAKKSLETITEEPSKDAKTEGEGLKIMTPNQLLARLPILLAQKKAGNNSQKLNNEIRQIIYSLCSSKNMSKKGYNHLMNSL